MDQASCPEVQSLLAREKLLECLGWQEFGCEGFSNRWNRGELVTDTGPWAFSLLAYSGPELGPRLLYC